ncbi:MAG: ybbK [Bacillota bacterium]|nr:ybbK [Bacillota bacterium]
MYLISACLAGVNCRYNGGNNQCDWVKQFMKDKDCLLVCPEEMGGLSTPRPPSERIGSKVISKDGQDVTDNFLTGAEKSIQKAEETAAELEQEIAGN